MVSLLNERQSGDTTDQHPMTRPTAQNKTVEPTFGETSDKKITRAATINQHGPQTLTNTFHVDYPTDLTCDE